MLLVAPFQILLVNFLAHIVIILFDKINIKYRIFNYVAMLVFVIGITIGFGYLFDWFAVNEIWIVCIVGIVVFIVALIIDIVKLNQDAKEINSDLEKLRKQKNKDKSE